MTSLSLGSLWRDAQKHQMIFLFGVGVLFSWWALEQAEAQSSRPSSRLTLRVVKKKSFFSKKSKHHRRSRRTKKERAFLHAGDISEGKALYLRFCASCHHTHRQGLTGSPLLPLFLRRRSISWLDGVLRRGKPATLMPAFPQFSAKQRASVIRFLLRPGRVSWSKKDVRKSLVSFSQSGSDTKVRNLRALTAVVERGKDRVWLMEGKKRFATFPAKNVHGGIKFSTDGRALFVPSRDGWIARYDLKKAALDRKVRACVYLRNLTLLRRDRYLVAACWLPRSLVVMDAMTLEPIKMLPLKGMVSAIYSIQQKKKAVFTFQDAPRMGILDAKDWSLQWRTLDVPLSDFFLDPLDRFLVGSSPSSRRLYVYDMEKKKNVFQAPLLGMPHLFSVAFWYEDGRFFFATPHMRSGVVSIWELYRWRFVKEIPVGGPGAFVRTHPMTPYLWADNGSDQLVLIDKKTWRVKKVRPFPKKRLMHTEFSADGRLGYVSIFEKKGALLILDAITLEEVGRQDADLPVGKYNFVHKQRAFARVQLGYEVFMSRCWGCHHTTQAAFAPSFLSIANKRHPAWIRAQLLDPKLTAKHLGYKRSVMPKIPLNAEEIEVLTAFILDLPKKRGE